MLTGIDFVLLILGVHGTFFLFSVVLLLSLPIVYCILPETKGGLDMLGKFCKVAKIKGSKVLEKINGI